MSEIIIEKIQTASDIKELKTLRQFRSFRDKLK